MMPSVTSWLDNATCLVQEDQSPATCSEEPTCHLSGGCQLLDADEGIVSNSADGSSPVGRNVVPDTGDLKRLFQSLMVTAQRAYDKASHMFQSAMDTFFQNVSAVGAESTIGHREEANASSDGFGGPTADDFLAEILADSSTQTFQASATAEPDLMAWDAWAAAQLESTTTDKAVDSSSLDSKGVALSDVIRLENGPTESWLTSSQAWSPLLPAQCSPDDEEKERASNSGSGTTASDEILPSDLGPSGSNAAVDGPALSDAVVDPELQETQPSSKHRNFASWAALILSLTSALATATLLILEKQHSSRLQARVARLMGDIARAQRSHEAELRLERECHVEHMKALKGGFEAERGAWDMSMQDVRVGE